MNLEQFLLNLNTQPESIQFSDTIAVIDSLYQFTPTRFKNGALISEPGQNSGSCKIFSFARMQGLTESQTLSCFGDYYRKDVLQNPSATDHQNIRNFMTTGWAGIEFDGAALSAK
uniref:HopJ type III effector protein n=1 Tax=Cellvibrio fontiphilus TaxID=1815559 RepID=UPI002B4BBC16|nr:HopJ type III effector protein [Cellvibrio fontiphilus]